MKRKFILLAMMLLTLIGGVKFSVLNAQIDLTKHYRLKVNEGGYAGKYLHVNSFNAPNNQPQVGIAVKAENTNQIFALEDAGNGNYYLKCATNDYYIKCAVGSQWWCVYAYSTTEKTPLYFHYTDGTDFYLRDYDKMMGIGGTDANLTTKNYFKVENDGVYCDAAPDYNSGDTYNANTSYVTTWSLEEVDFSVAVSADATEIWSDETVNLTAIVMGRVGGCTYSWSPATGLDDATSATPVFTPTAAGTYTFTCTATDANGATVTSEEISILVKDVKDKPAIQDIVVGNGSGTINYLPTYTYYGNTISQQIYTAADLALYNSGNSISGKINKIAFNVSNYKSANRKVDVYMINTTKTGFSATTDWISMTDDDLVYSGEVHFANGWVEISLDNDFIYEGDNILLCVNDKTNSYTSYGAEPYFYTWTPNGDNASEYRTLVGYKDAVNYDAHNFSGVTAKTRQYFVNQIKFTVEVSTDPSIEVNYTSLDFGTVRAGGDFWTEKETPSFNVNVKAKYTAIKTITGNDDFFRFSDVSGAVDQTEFNFTVSYNKAAEAGEKSGNIVVTYMNGEEEATVEIPMTATAYVPDQGDVVENPIEVTFDENGVYTYTINSLDGFYDDYVFSPNEQYDADAPDMVFSFTLTEDALVTISNLGWSALYGDYTVENGPQYDVDYPDPNTLLSAGTYYAVCYPNSCPSEFSITKSSVPAPEISYSSPTDESENNDNPALTWNMQYADEYQVLFGISEDALEVVAAETAIEGQTEYSFQTSELQNNTKYYWQVIATNKAGTTTGEVRSFVTLLDVPQITSATAVNLYPDEITTIKWEAVTNATSYKVYNGEWTVLATLEATETSYELSGLEHNMTGYNITVTAIQEGLGESLKSEPVVVKVAGTFPLKVNVKDSNDSPIKDATVTFNTSSALDEFQNTITAPEPLTTNAEGVAEIILPLIYNDPSIFGEQIIVYANKTPFKQNFTSITPSGLSNDVLKEVNINLYLPAPSSLYPENYEYMLLVGDNLTLNWTAVEGVTGYNVYKTSGNGVYTFVETVAENTYTKVAEYDGEGSYYAVSAVFEGGLESDKISTSGRIYVFRTGDVKGLVTDTEGNPVAGASLELSGTTGFGEDIHILETEADGTFLVEDVIEGTYSLTVSHYNYEAATVSDISVSNIEYELEIELTPKASIENVTVTADNNGKVSWTGDYAKWNVYRRNTNAPQELTPVATKLSTTSTTDAAWGTLEPGTYQYGVAALVEPQAQTRGDEEIIIDFEDGNLPEGWTIRNGANNGSPIWKVGNRLSTSAIYSRGSGMAYSSGAGTEAKYYLITSELSSVNKISYYYALPSWAGDVSYFTVEYTTDLNGGLWIPLTEKYGDVKEWTYGEIDLSEIKGSFYLAFVHEDHFGYGVAIDDIVITSGTPLVETQIVWSDDVVKQGPATFIGGDTENPTAWNVDANWSTGSVPADGAEVTINANAVISSEVNVASITINNGDSYPYNTLTVADKGILTVTGTISQQSDYLLVLEEGGQIFQNNDNVKARFRMSIDNPSDWSDEAKKDGWQFISMPMADVTYTDFTSYGEYDLYKYDGSQDLEWLNHKAGIFAETEFISGKGYLASLKEAETATVYGTLNTSTYFSSYFAYNADKDLANFRLIGNPFTYDIKWGDMNPHQLADGFAIVNKDGNYEYYSGADAVIKVGQGFFIKAIAGESQYSQYIYSKQRSTRESNNSLNITATGNAGEDNVIINFAGKSEGFDKLQNFNDAIATVYVAEDGKNYGIYNCDTDVQEVELCFNANQMGNYTISIEPNGKFQSVTLVDRFTGIETNMLVEDYHFTAMSNVNNNRFIIKMVNGQQTTDNSHFVYQSGEDLIIDAEGTVQIIDVMGRVLLSDEVESTNNRINVSGFQDGTYMVRVINGSEVKVEKVVIY